MEKLNYEVALKMAADVVNANRVEGQLDVADPNTMSAFTVRFERNEQEVTLTVAMELKRSPRAVGDRRLEVFTRFGSTARTMSETREFLALLADVTAVGEKVSAALAGFTFMEGKCV